MYFAVSVHNHEYSQYEYYHATRICIMYLVLFIWDTWAPFSRTWRLFFLEKWYHHFSHKVFSFLFLWTWCVFVFSGKMYVSENIHIFLCRKTKSIAKIYHYVSILSNSMYFSLRRPTVAGEKIKNKYRLRNPQANFEKKWRRTTSSFSILKSPYLK